MPCIVPAGAAALSRVGYGGVAALQVEQQHAGILHRCLNLAQEGDGLSAVDEPVIVGQRHVHHRPHLDLGGDTGSGQLSAPA